MQDRHARGEDPERPAQSRCDQSQSRRHPETRVQTSRTHYDTFVYLVRNGAKIFQKKKKILIIIIRVLRLNS